MRAVLSGTSLTASGFGHLDAGCEHASGEGRRLTEMRIVMPWKVGVMEENGSGMRMD